MTEPGGGHAGGESWQSIDPQLCGSLPRREAGGLFFEGREAAKAQRSISVNFPPPKRGRTRAAGERVGVMSKCGGMTPARRFAPTSPLQGKERESSAAPDQHITGRSPQHDIERAEHGGHIGQHVAFAHVVHRLRDAEGGRADLAAIGLVRSRPTPDRRQTRPSALPPRHRPRLPAHDSPR